MTSNKKINSLQFLVNFAKQNGLSKRATAEIMGMTIQNYHYLLRKGHIRLSQVYKLCKYLNTSLYIQIMKESDFNNDYPSRLNKIQIIYSGKPKNRMYFLFRFMDYYNLTPDDVANKLGVHKNTVMHWGHINYDDIPFKRILEIAEKFDMNIYLLFIQNDDANSKNIQSKHNIVCKYKKIDNYEF